MSLGGLSRAAGARTPSEAGHSVREARVQGGAVGFQRPGGPPTVHPHDPATEGRPRVPGGNLEWGQGGGVQEEDEAEPEGSLSAWGRVKIESGKKAATTRPGLGRGLCKQCLL